MTPIFYKLRQNTACHGRGRGFEPRRPRRTFQMTYGMIWRREISEIGCNLGAVCTQFAPKKRPNDACLYYLSDAPSRREDRYCVGDIPKEALNNRLKWAESL